MDSGPTLKPKVTVKLTYKPSTSTRPPSRNNSTKIPSRPASPTKSYASTNTNLDSNVTFRPKAKVNSSATTRKAPASSSVSGSTCSTPRAGSPAKLTPRNRNGAILPPLARKASSTLGVSRGLRSPAPVSAPTTPELRHRSLTTTSPSPSPLGPTDESRTRPASVSLHHAVSYSSFHPSSVLTVSTSNTSEFSSASPSPRLMPSKSTLGLSECDKTSSPTMRIRSKVSSAAKSTVDSFSAPPTPGFSSPSLQSATRPTFPRPRAPSISSTLAQQPQATSPPPQFYPITAASPAANPHRFARPSPPSAQHIFQSFSRRPMGTAASDVSPSSRPRSVRLENSVAKVDPASIPSSPHSPPASSLSFSSRSSVSRSSASVSYVGAVDSHSPSTNSKRLSPATQQSLNGNMDYLKTTLNNLMEYTSDMQTADNSGGDSGHDRDTDGEMEHAEDHKVKAAAKSNRKIADLEITNRSLLAINGTLEATKHRQAKEIRELRRKLRESRLILPPRAFRAVKSSLGPAEIADDEEDVEEEDQDGSDAENDAHGAGDEIYLRIKLILDNLLKSGQRALETEVDDFSEGTKGTAKVLTAEEVRDWRGIEHGEHAPDRSKHDIMSEKESHELHADSIPLDPDDISFDDFGNDSFASEDEVEAMTIPAGSPPSSPPPPPILVTQPSREELKN